MIRKLRSEAGGFTRREVLLSVLIFLMVFYFTTEFMKYLSAQQRIGDDALRANTAESVALIESDAGVGCPVKGCSGGSGCTHQAGDYYIGYYDDVQNTIVGKKPYGYNESSNPRINGKTYYGSPGTLVIRVMTGQGTLTLNWETGKK